MAKLYSGEIYICATAYVVADSEEEALATIRGLDGSSLELPTGLAGGDEWVEITGEMFSSDMPELSLSPAVTVYASSISPDLMKLNPITGVDFQEDFDDADDDGEADGVAKAGVGRMWWNADDLAEATTWRTEMEPKGVRFVTVEPLEASKPDGRYTVIVELPRDKAEEILGYVPDEEEWLEEEDSPAD